MRCLSIAVLGLAGCHDTHLIADARAIDATRPDAPGDGAQNDAPNVVVDAAPDGPDAPVDSALDGPVDSAPDGPVDAALDATIDAPTVAQLQITPDTRDFGSVVVGQTSGPLSFTITNIGGSTSGTLSTLASGTDVAAFTKTADGCNGTPLFGAASCTLTVVFSPQTGGVKSAAFTVSGTPGGSVVAQVIGTTPAALSIAPPTGSFPETAVGQTSPGATFTVKNTGGIPTGSLFTSLDGANAGEFTFAGTDGCATTVLQPQGTCTIGVRFAPTTTTPTAKAAALAVAASPGGTVMATLGGNAAVISAIGSLGLSTACNGNVCVLGDLAPQAACDITQTICVVGGLLP